MVLQSSDKFKFEDSKSCRLIAWFYKNISSSVITDLFIDGQIGSNQVARGNDNNIHSVHFPLWVGI